MTLILGIESSCDETAASVVRDGRQALSSVIKTQIDVHRAFGGVVPEIAAREHLKLIEFYREHEVFPQNDKACQFCEFKSICHTTPPLREGKIRQEFVTRELTGVLASGADSDDS